MGIRNRFNKVFGITDDLRDERIRFVQRVNQDIFHVVDTEFYIETEIPYGFIFKDLCLELGVNAHTVPKRVERDILNGDTYYQAPIRTLTSDRFDTTLLVLCSLYAILQGLPKEREWFDSTIRYIMEKATCDLGVRWHEGFFYPSGAKELDESLIEETLTWLEDLPDEQRDFKAALKAYTANSNLGDVIKNCYSALEGTARNILGNSRTLDNNKDELLRKIDLSAGWKSIVAKYIDHAHEFRHASKNRHTIPRKEAEAFLYMTGLLIRLLLETKQVAPRADGVIESQGSGDNPAD